MAAGVVALVLQANQNLTWRDMQHLVVRTARRITPNHHDWQRNGAGRWFSHYYGYGLLVRSHHHHCDHRYDSS
jgi:furin